MGIFKIRPLHLTSHVERTEYESFTIHVRVQLDYTRAIYFAYIHDFWFWNETVWTFYLVNPKVAVKIRARKWWDQSLLWIVFHGIIWICTADEGSLRIHSCHYVSLFLLQAFKWKSLTSLEWLDFKEESQTVTTHQHNW